MMRSLNEVGSVSLKAALGAKIPLGQAEDLALTAMYLSVVGSGLEIIVDVLHEPDVPLDVAFGKDRVVVKAGNAAMTGPIVKDAFVTGATKARLASEDHVPFITAMLAEAGCEVTTHGAIIEHAGALDQRQMTGPVDVPDDIWDVLQGLAARTYVPESDASRSGGAGAGLTDND